MDLGLEVDEGLRDMRVSRTAEFVPDITCWMGPSLSRGPSRTYDVSVVMPCLNEQAAVGATVREALAGIRSAGLTGEVIVVDNGSSDDSARTARLAGARVVAEPNRGYGHACRVGLAQARGRIVVLGDADGTYDFGAIPKLIDAMKADVDVVMGNRLNAEMQRGAMPWLHRRVGNPALTGLLNLLFTAGVSDAHCGLRAIRGEALSGLELRTPGMEFASEFVIEAALNGLRIVEVPITYRRRFGGEPKLRTWSDGWRHLHLILSMEVKRRHSDNEILYRKPPVVTLDITA